MSTDFQGLAGIALILFAICAPISYCTVQRGGPTSGNDLHLACINAKGEWKSESLMSSPTCIFPQDQPKGNP